jgi:hypothetical protein
MSLMQRSTERRWRVISARPIHTTFHEFIPSVPLALLFSVVAFAAMPQASASEPKYVIADEDAAGPADPELCSGPYQFGQAISGGSILRATGCIGIEEDRITGLPRRKDLRGGRSEVIEQRNADELYINAKRG